MQDDLWALDFAAAYRAEIERFWRGSGWHFKALARLNLLGQAVRAQQVGRIEADDLAQVRQMVGATSTPPTLAQLQHDAAQAPLQVSHYDLRHGSRPWLYSFTAPDGRVMLYMPWSDQALRAFASQQQMAGWVRTQLQDPTQLTAFARAALGNGRHTDQH